MKKFLILTVMAILAIAALTSCDTLVKGTSDVANAANGDPTATIVVPTATATATTVPPTATPTTAVPTATATATTVPPTATPTTAVPTATATATTVPPTATPNADVADCIAINDYGIEGKPELSVSDNNNRGFLHVQYWWPGIRETETVLPAGRYIIVGDLRGHVWEYLGACSVEQMMSQVKDSINRRQENGVNTLGYVNPKVLLQSGRLEIAVQHDPSIVLPETLDVVQPTATTQPTTSAGVAATPTRTTAAGAGRTNPTATPRPATGGGSTICSATRATDLQRNQPLSPVNYYRTIELWDLSFSGIPVKIIAVIPSGVGLSGTYGGGAIWEWKGCSEQTTVINDAKSKSNPAYLRTTNGWQPIPE